MGEKKLPYWMAVEEGKTITVAELVHKMAKATNPDDGNLMNYGAARVNLAEEVKQAVNDGTLIVRNAAGLSRHTMPHGDELLRAVLIPFLDLEPFLNSHGIELRLTPHGSGPHYWTLENTAIALQAQERWHDGTRASFQDRLQEAAQRGEVVIRDPHTCLPVNSGHIRTFWQLVTPSDVNSWLEKQAAPYRWNVEVLEDAPEPQPAPMVEGASNGSDVQKIPMKKAALIAALQHEWPSIVADFSESSRNGLTKAAHTGEHGYWYESRARAWAVSHGKIRQSAAGPRSASWLGPVTRHQL